MSSCLPHLTTGELRLLLSSLTALPAGSFSDLPRDQGEGLQDLYSAVASGRWEQALHLPIVSEAIAFDATKSGGSDEELLKAACSASRAVLEDTSSRGSRRSLALLAAGAAALGLFVEANFLGPVHRHLPRPSKLINPSGSTEPSGTDTLERQAAKQLEVDGEELVGRLSVPGYLLLARALLIEPLRLPTAHVPEEGASSPQVLRELPSASWGWWALRTLSCHQRVVSRRSATLRGQQRALGAHITATWGEAEWAAVQVEVALGGAVAGNCSWMAPLLCGCCLMELGALEDLYGDIAEAAATLEAAGDRMGMELSLTGVMGKRTVHQEDEKAQLVARLQRTGVLSSLSLLEDQCAAEEQTTDEPTPHGPGHVASGWKESEDLADVMDMPALEHSDSSLGLEGLTSAEQILLLRAAVHEKKREAGDAEVKMWRMAPFVEAVLRQGRSAPAVAAAANLMRCRHEASRSRTKQRAFLRFTDLVEGILNAVASGPRSRLVHCSPLPPLPSIRKEYAEMMISIGLVGDAMRVFEELELWNSLITCYTMMDKKLQATELIRKRLEEYPDDASLLCSLGDCTGDDQAYVDAWEKSGHRSARAMRSLADSAHRRKDFMRAAACWEAALALNPLHSSGWFSLGHCYLKFEELDKAVQAFTRCCQLEPDNGPSWNNVAAVCLSQKKYKEAFVALAESTKYQRQSWHTWDNYTQVAVLVGNYSAAVTGLRHMVELRQGKDVPMEAVSAVVGYLMGLAAKELKDSHLLYSRTGELLKAIAGLGDSNPKFWRAFARFHGIAGHLAAERECLVKCTRAMAGTPWQKEESKFEEMAEASHAFAEAALSSVGAGDSSRRKDLSQARLQLKSVAKQAKDRFEEHAMYAKILEVLERVVCEEARLKEAADGTSNAADGAVDGLRTAGAGIRGC